MEEFIETFHIDWHLMLAQAINFGLVFAIFYFLAAKPLSKLVKDRGTEIETGLMDAKQNAEMLKATKEEYEKMLAKARADAAAISKTAKAEDEKRKAEMQEQTQIEMTKALENNKKAMEAEKSRIMAEVKNDIAVLAVQATERLIGRKIDGSVDKNTTEELSKIKK